MLRSFDLETGVLKFLSSGNLVFFAKNLNDEFLFVSDNIEKFGIPKIKFFDDSNFYYYLVSAEEREKEIQRNTDFFLDFNQHEIISNYSLKSLNGITYRIEERKWKSFDEFGEVDFIYGVLFFRKDSVIKGFPFSADNVIDIFYKSPNSICIMKLGSNEILFSNNSFKELFGNISIFDLDSILSTKTLLEYINLDSEFKNLELNFSTLRGNKWFNCNAYSYIVSDQKFSILFMYDISNKKNLEKEVESFYDFADIFSSKLFQFDSSIFEVYNKLLRKTIQFSGFTSGLFGEYFHENEQATISISTFLVNGEIVEFLSKDSTFPKSKISQPFIDVLQGEDFLYKEFYNASLRHLLLEDKVPDINIKNFLFFKESSKMGSSFICFLFNSSNVVKSSVYSFDLILPIFNVFINFKYLYSYYKSNLLKEISISETNKIYSLLTENMDDVVGITDKKLIIGFVSPSVYWVCGVEDQFLINKSIFDFFDLKSSISSFRTDAYKEVFTFKHYVFSRELKLEIFLKPIFNDKSYLESYIFKIRDVTLEDKYLNELKNSLNKEKEINEIKSKIISLSSHEYRTPLSVIQSSADILQLLLADYYVDEKVLKLLKKINTQVEKLSNIISQTLIFDHDSKQFSFNKEVFDLYQLILNLVNSEFSKFNIHVDVNKRSSKVYTDPYVVSKILKVLI